jgi:hypothetical protein
MKIGIPKYLILFCCLISVNIISACAKQSLDVSSSPMIANEFSKERVESDRMVIWSASITLEANNISEAIPDIVSHIEKQGGFVENKSVHGEESAHLTLRVPSDSIISVVDSLSKFGHEKHRTVSSEDVTEQFIDTEARLQNAIVLRNRLKELLNKANDVKDILAIEKELARIQADIDSMEGRLKRLKGKIDFASINLYLEQKTILGPLGYLGKGIWWFIEKLFVIK